MPQSIAQKTGSRLDVVAPVQAAVSEGKTIRAIVEQSVTNAMLALSAELEDCARTYTGCAKTDDLVFDEAVEFVIERFGYLNISEIRQAFRLAGAGEIGPVKLEAYFGTFTIVMLGSVLSAYKTYRDKISAAVVFAEKEAGLTRHEELSSRNHDRKKWAEGRLAGLLGNEGLSVDGCMVYDHEYFTESGQMEYSEEEKREAWKDAYPLTIREYQGRLESGSVGVQFVLQKVANQQHDEGFQATRIMFAKRLLVLRWIEKLRTQHSLTT